MRTVADLKLRCWVDEDTDCWQWRGGHSGDGHPRLWLPALGRPVTLGIAACYLRTGKKPEKGSYWRTVCGTKDCANPAHRKPGTRSQQMLAHNMRRDQVQRSRVAAGKRAVSSLSDEAVQDIRSSAEVLRVVAQRHGISIAHASAIRRGESRVLMAPASSVFSAVALLTGGLR